MTAKRTVAARKVKGFTLSQPLVIVAVIDVLMAIPFRFITARKSPFFCRQPPEYRKRMGPRTVDLGWKEVDDWTGGGYHEEHPGNEDLRWVPQRVWGRLGY